MVKKFPWVKTVRLLNPCSSSLYLDVDRDDCNVSEDFGLVGFALHRCRFGITYTLTVRADVIDNFFINQKGYFNLNFHEILKKDLVTGSQLGLNDHDLVHFKNDERIIKNWFVAQVLIAEMENFDRLLRLRDMKVTGRDFPGMKDANAF